MSQAMNGTKNIPIAVYRKFTEAFNLAVKVVPVSVSKNKKDDFVPIPKELCFEGKGKIFGRGHNYFSSRFLALRKELKLNENINLYSIKHTRAVHLAEDGVSPYAIMQLFRHSSIDITMTYLRGLGVNVGREAVDKSRNI